MVSGAMTSLAFRFSVFNIAAGAAVIWAAQLGYIERVFTGDVSGISYAIAALFAVGLVATARHVWMFPSTDSIKQRFVADVADWLVLMGLVGNVIGLLHAFGGAELASLSTTEGIQSFAAQMLAGLGVAFYSTLVGTVLCLWTQVNFRMLDTATALEEAA